MRWLKIAGKILLGLILAIFALIGALAATKGTPNTTVFAFGDPAGPPAAADSFFLRSMALLTNTPLDPGHATELLLNGNGTYPRLWQDMRNAQSSIEFHVYYCKPGAVADSLKIIASERARAGVRVLLLFDAFGAQSLSDEYRDSLTSAGVKLASYRPVRWYSLHRAQHRSHMRLVVIDDSIGYTGGFGIADHWLGDGVSEGWRDTNVRFSGPAVAKMQSAFAVTWAEATGELLTGRYLAGPHSAQDTLSAQTAGLLFAQPTLGITAAERFLVLSIAGARRTIFIANAYFVPDHDLKRQLMAAAKRGIDVRVLTAGPKTDVRSVRHAGHSRYEELLGAGVRIFEYAPQMMHTKTMIVDGVWSTVGSMNFDNRSLAFNDESNLIVHDSVFARTLEQQFMMDVSRSREFKLEQFRRRSAFHKLLDAGFSLGAKLL
jgi:cardiolipin synthase A/B